MTEIPDMPRDFWPKILVTGKYEGKELGFVCPSLDDNGWQLNRLIDALRLSLWQAHHLGIKTDA